MSDVSEETEGSDESFDFVTHLDIHSNLIVVVGVFAALAIYMSRTTGVPIDQAPTIVQTGYVTSILLALLVFVIFFATIYREFENFHEFLMAHFRLANWDLLFFTVLSTLLIMSMWGLVRPAQGSVYLAIIVGVLFLTTLGLLRGLTSLARHVPKSPTRRIPILFILSWALLGVSHWAFTWLEPRVELLTLSEFTLSKIFLAVPGLVLMVLVVMRSLAAWAILITILAIPIVFLDKIRGTGFYKSD